MPASKISPEAGGADVDVGLTVGKAKIKGKKKKEPPKKKGGKFKRQQDEDPFGKPDDYPSSLPLGPRHFVEFHERTDESLGLEHFGDCKIETRFRRVFATPL